MQYRVWNKMKHGLNYVTDLGGWVCKCMRYFDDEQQDEVLEIKDLPKISKGKHMEKNKECKTCKHFTATGNHCYYHNKEVNINGVCNNYRVS